MNTNNNIKASIKGLEVTVNMTVEELYRWANALRYLVENNAHTEFHQIDTMAENEAIMWLTSDFARDYNGINHILKQIHINQDDLVNRKCLSIDVKEVP